MELVYIKMIMFGFLFLVIFGKEVVKKDLS